MSDNAEQPQTSIDLDSAGLSSEQLNEFTNELLTQNHPGKLREAAFRLHSLFADVTGVSIETASAEDLQETILTTGTAICPRSAGMCVLEYMRTAKFLRGLNNALLELQRRFANEPLEILYAGCGPFAALLAPLAARFAPGQLRITLLDVHDRALQSARLIFETFGLEDQLAGCVLADAAVYRHPRPLHLVVTETMLAALRKEPQVGVTFNLAPQLSAGGILIPQKVAVEVCLYNPATELVTIPAEADESFITEAESKRVRINLGRLIELTAENSKQAAADDFLSPVVVSIPETTDNKLKLLLKTTVTIFESIVLEEYESSITYPLMLKDYTPVGSDRLEFTYHSGYEPGFTYQRVI